MSGSGAGPIPAGRVLWAGALLLAGSACAGSVAAVMSGAGWGAVLAAVAAAGLLALLIALVRSYGAALVAAGQLRAGIEQLAGEYERCQDALRRQAAESLQREEGHRSMLATRAATLQAAASHAAAIAVPAALYEESLPSMPWDGSTGNADAAALLAPVIAAVAEGAARLRARLDERAESSRLAVVALARRVQASAHRIQEEATQMAERHPGDADVLESSMRMDHAAAQQARHAQTVAVLCGEWPAQQWPEALALVDVVRAAAGRIVPFTRITVLGDPDVAATPAVVEPLIHLVAELLANATQSSPPTTQVQVAVRTVQRGAVIEIDDGGVGMDERRLEGARGIASGRREAGLSELGEIPQTGLAVVGQYARRHALRVDLMPSAYGGVRVVVLVPGEVTEILEPAGAQRADLREASPARDRGGEEVPPAEDAVARLPGGLPRRHSRRGPAIPPVAGGNQERTCGPVPELSPEQAGAWMSAFLRGQPARSGCTDTATGGADTPVIGEASSGTRGGTQRGGRLS